MPVRKKIGLIGCGNWGQNILRDLVTLGCEVHVVARSDGSRQRALTGHAHQVVNRLTDLGALDGIVIATPSATHAEIIEQALNFPVPVFVEKPMTVDPISAKRLAELAPDRLFVMDKWRYHPGVHCLRDLVRSGELGPVTYLKTTRMNWGNPHRDTDGIWHLLPHDLSIGLEILGIIPPPISAVGEMAGSTALSIIAYLGTRPAVVHEVSIRSPIWQRKIELHCENGVAILDDSYADHVAIYRGELKFKQVPKPETRPISKKMPLYQELKTFVEFLEGGPAPKSSAADGCRIVETIAALRALAGFKKAG